MNPLKHTPGPWNVDGDATVYGPRFSIANDKEQIGRFEVADCKGYKQEREANARLIASAPDLLRALEQLLETAESLNDWLVSDGSINGEHELFKKVRAIISKAKGEA
jgi:hypothetical protein